MDATMERPLRKAAIGARDHVLAADEACDPYQTLGDELGMFDDIGRMTDDARDQHLAPGKLHVLPYFPFVLVARVGAFDHIGAYLHPKDEVDDMAARRVAA